MNTPIARATREKNALLSVRKEEQYVINSRNQGEDVLEEKECVRGRWKILKDEALCPLRVVHVQRTCQEPVPQRQLIDQ